MHKVSEEHEMLRDLVKKFVRNELMPLEKNILDRFAAGQPAALATDVIALMDALGVGAAILGGCDWGARTADIVAALWPERCKALVSVSGYLIGSQAAGKIPLPPAAELLEKWAGWLAGLSPWFHAGLLLPALQQCASVTDEASAVEALGLKPKLVAGDSSNFKVTYPQDLRMAELLLGDKTCV